MKTQIKIPRRILEAAGMTTRQWKQHKRYEARLLERAVNNFGFAAGFTPAADCMSQLRATVKDIRRSLKVSSWGN